MPKLLSWWETSKTSKLNSQALFWVYISYEIKIFIKINIVILINYISDSIRIKMYHECPSWKHFSSFNSYSWIWWITLLIQGNGLFTKAQLCCLVVIHLLSSGERKIIQKATELHLQADYQVFSYLIFFL